MKIAIIAPEVLPVPPVRGGGIETIIEEVSARLPNCEVHIFGISDPELPNEEIREGRKYHRWRRGLTDRLMLASWRFPFKQSRSGWYYWPYIQWAARKLCMIKPDVVWIHARPHFVSAIRKACPNTRIILSVHNVSNYERGNGWVENRIDAADIVTGCSRYLTDAIRSKFPKSREKAAVLYNGVDPQAFAPQWLRKAERDDLRRRNDLTGFVILFAGRLVEQKGVHLLLDAFIQFLASNPDSTLLIVGSHTYSEATQTPYIERLHEQAKGLGGRVRFIGFVSPERMSEFYLMSDAVVFPSVWREPFGLTVIEAMAAGLPVIAFNQGGPSEIIKHNDDGYLVPLAEGAGGLAEALAGLSKDPGLRERVGRAARQTAEERFSWENMSGQFLSLCNGKIADRPVKDEIMTSSPLVSVIIPAYNRANLLPETIESALSQTYPHHEIIVVDDGSTDETAGIIKQYDGKVRYFYQENQGPSAARNRGIKEARGEYVAFLDADDLWAKEKLKIQVDYMTGHPETALCFADASAFSGERTVVQSMFAEHKPYSGDCFYKMLRENCIPTQTVLVRKEALLAVGGFDENFRASEDYGLWLRLSKKYKFGFVRDVLAHYRLHEQNVSMDLGKMATAHFAVMEKVMAEEGVNQKVRRKMLSCYLLKAGYNYFDVYRLKEAREKLISSIRYWPANAKAYLYLSASFLPLGILRLIRNHNGTRNKNDAKQTALQNHGRK